MASGVVSVVNFQAADVRSKVSSGFPGRTLVPGLALTAAALALQFGLVQPARPQETPASDSAILDQLPPDPEALSTEKALRGEELEKLRSAIAVSTSRQAEIAAEIDALDKDRATINDQLVATADRIQSLEQSLTSSEERLAKHMANEAAIRDSLESRRAVLIDVLAAAQRIGRQPPPALVVKPEDALGAIRSAIVLGAVMPELRIEAESLASDLAALVAVRESAETERDQLRADAGRLAEEQARLTLLLTEKKTRAEAETAALDAERKAAADLAGKAQSLEELIKGLEARMASLKPPEPLADQPRPSIDDGGRLRPAMAFETAKAQLPMPVRGVLLQNFGDDNGLGGHAQGITIATRAGARVIAPTDGRIVFAGPFRSYGRLLILDVGDGYHIVMAGMENVDVEMDQFILRGEPVGVMGSQRLASATQPDASLSQPALYIEFRKDNTSIDPAPWWAASQDRKVGG